GGASRREPDDLRSGVRARADVRARLHPCQALLAGPQVLDLHPRVVAQAERVPEDAVAEVDARRVEDLAAVLVLPAVVAALVGGLGLRRPLRQVAPLLAAVAGVPVVVAGVPRPDVPDGRERAAPGRRAHLDRVVAAAPRREGPPGRARHEVVPLAEDR